VKPLVFLDTGAIYSLADPNDRDHAAVSEAYNSNGRTFVLHELILFEAFSLLTKRLYKEAALRTVGAFRLSSRVEKIPLTPDLLEAAWQRCRRFADKEWDWIDCVSFELMERRGIRDALSLDRHFAQAGFSLLVR
jgi:predicted nucleic acid-binding protein